MNIEIRQARDEDKGHVSAILIEAASWLNSINQPLWQCSNLVENVITEDVHAGLFYIARLDGQPAGVFKFQFEDKIIWPDVPTGESAFLHRLAVRRIAAGTGLAGQMLEYAKKMTRQSGRKFLRLDCAKRPKLCAFYERNWFSRNGDCSAGSYCVARYGCNVEFF